MASLSNSPGRRLSWAIRRATRATLDALYPPRCAGCQRWGERFCSLCRAASAPLPTPICPRCGYPQARDQLCRQCRVPLNAALSAIRSAAFFEGPLQHAIHRLKYRNDPGLADSLSRLLARAWRQYGLSGEMVVPVPLSCERLRQRGYNQAALLARALAERVGVPYARGALQRTRDTASQVNLGWRERQANVAGAFASSAEWVQGRQVVLVDDVCTTGATLAACAAALAEVGAAEVKAITLARARWEATL